MFNEVMNNAKVRAPYNKVFDWAEALPKNTILKKQIQAENLFKKIGVTFSVYNNYDVSVIAYNVGDSTAGIGSTDFGSIVVPSGYSRARHCGTDSLPPTNNVTSNGTQLRAGGNHGTPCGSIMYGKNHGWAFNSNKWSLSYPLGQADAPAGDACIDAIKVFHQYKPTNPKHGTKDPTVTNCSFTTGGSIGLGSINFDEFVIGLRVLL